MYCILSFASASFSTQPQPSLVFLQFEVGSDKNILDLSNEVLLSEIKLNHGNTKATSKRPEAAKILTNSCTELSFPCEYRAKD